MKSYYHNFTQNIVNEGSKTDFIERYKNGDIIYKSEAGDACLHEITISEFSNMIEDYIIFAKGEYDSETFADIMRDIGTNPNTI